MINIKPWSKEVYSEMYILYFKKLFNYGKKFTGDTSIIEDTIDEVFIFIWINIDNLQSINLINSYIYSSFRNNLFKKIKSLNHIRFCESGWENEIEFSIESILIKKESDIEIKNQLENAMQYLTSRQRESIFLRFYERLSFIEISDIMEISVKSTYKLITRALIKMKEVFSISSFLKEPSNSKKKVLTN